MSKYICQMCGYVFDEMAEEVKFKNLDEEWNCLLCASPKSLFKEEKIEEDKSDKKINDKNNYTKDIDYDGLDTKTIKEIIKLAKTGQSEDEPMETLKSVPKFEDILLLSAQLDKIPLDDQAYVNTETVIGKKAQKPMVISTPIYISHMSFGALSRRAKIGLAKASAIVNTATCSGEGGILPEEKSEAGKYIFEYVPNLYSVTDENLREADAIEIKIGQSTKPGMGGYLPGNKVTEAIAKIRNRPVGEAIKSPSNFENVKTQEDLKRLIEDLRKRSEGRPIGVKISAGHVEKDLEFISKSTADFVTIDGRGGATGSSPKFLKDSSCIPTVYALARASKYIKETGMNIDLIITGGLRTSADFAKAIALGADAVAIASSAIIALGCRKYRICNTGHCPTGVASHLEELESKIDIDKSAEKVARFINASTEEIRVFARCAGKRNVHDLSLDDIVTTSMDISSHTNIKHV